jgi:outer membrane immunogenic protein
MGGALPLPEVTAETNSQNRDMHMRKLLLTTAALVALTAGEGFGADLRAPAYKAPPMAALPMWAGWYGGVNLGYMSLTDRVNHFDSGSDCWWDCDVLHFRDHSSGVLGGLQVGYNWQAGNIVYGLETDVNFASVRTHRTAIDGDYLQNSDLSAIGTVRARLGWAVDRTLIYATGGFAYANVHDHVNDSDDPGLWDKSAWLGGWVAGGGIEYAMGARWSIKAEAMFYELENRTIVFTDVNSSPPNTFPATFKHDGVIARAGVNFKFGGP